MWAPHIYTLLTLTSEERTHMASETNCSPCSTALLVLPPAAPCRQCRNCCTRREVNASRHYHLHGTVSNSAWPTRTLLLKEPCVYLPPRYSLNFALALAHLLPPLFPAHPPSILFFLSPSLSLSLPLSPSLSLSHTYTHARRHRRATHAIWRFACRAGALC